MSVQFTDRLLAAAPFAATVVLTALAPLYDRIVDKQIEAEFSGLKYLPNAQTAHTPLPVLRQFYSWTADLALAGSSLVGPAVGIAFADSADVGVAVRWLYFAFVIIGSAILLATIGIKNPADYGRRRWARFYSPVTFSCIVLYSVAGLAAALLAGRS